jgi:aminoglycoside phosphotransferase family enzyme/predicted kinase
MTDADQYPALIQGLLSPRAYPHPVTTPVRVAETHISWVLLTGPFAYKIKKPLKLSFLDYSTIALRRAFCEEEVRLNRRYAADLYLGVAAITGTQESPVIDGETDSTLEFAVRMRQFDASQELGALLESRQVSTSDLADLGRHVARFHALADCAGEKEAFGLPAKVHQVTLDNFTELGSALPVEMRKSALEPLREHVDEQFESLGDTMSERRRAGLIRECHGDLHCANVVRWKDELTPFDGIEFDPALRFIDVVSDLAFLTMDLSAHGRPDLRHAALQAWAETLGDFDGLRLLPYFECYRALVRAKVSALRAAQEAPGSAQHGAALATAEHYLCWAEAETNRFTPRLLLTCGVSGSGKTWVARQVAAQLPALHLRSDIERKRLAGLDPLADSRSEPGAGIYTPSADAETYGRLYSAAESCLQAGENVIVDATFILEKRRKVLINIAKRLKVPFTILHCTAPRALLRERVASRALAGTDASEAGAAILERQLSHFDMFSETEQANVLEIDTSVDFDINQTLQDLG